MEAQKTLQELQEQFREQARVFPELHHFVMVWPEGKPKPDYPNSYTNEFIEDSYCHIGIDTPNKRYKDEYQIWHCVIKPRYCQWDKLRAAKPLKRLAERVMQFATGYVSQGVMNLTTPLDRWLLSVHELTKSKQIFLAYAMPAYYMEISDVFSESAIACSVLIERLKKSAGTGQKEIVEVKPGAFGITVNIKEIAKRIWKCVCSRSKD